MKKLLIYWPMGVFEDLQIHKEIGAIAVSASKLDVESSIVCGKFRSSQNQISSHETCLVKRNLITKLLDPFIAFKFIVNESPDYMLFYNIENYGNLILILALHLIRIIRNSNKRNIKIMIKADTDGSFIESRNSAYLMIYKLLILLYLKFSDGVIIETTCALKKIANFVGKNDRLIYIPDGYSKDLFQKVNNSPRKRMLTCPARITPIKNIEAVLRIFNRLVINFEDLQLKITGYVQDKDYFKKIKQMILQMNLDRKVEISYLGEENLAKLFGESLLTISTSLKESFGIARMESLGSGTPVVTYDVGCGADFMTFGAVVVPIGDENRMYNEIVKLLSDHQYWTQKSIEGKSLAVSWDSVVIKLLSFFR